MPRVGPVSRKELIATLRRLGFRGPFSGSRHQFMVRADRKVFIPNPHSGDIGRQLLTRVLKQAGIGRDEWQRI